MTTTKRTITRPAADVPSAPPRWAVRTAHIIPLLTLPSGLWRLWLAGGHRGGYTEAGYEAMGIDGWGTVYVIGLSVAVEAAALLTLGLVRPWGERVPEWIPVLGGRRVAVRAAVVPAAAGAVALTVLWSPFVLWWTVPHHGMTDTGNLVAGLLYLPLVAWGPLLGAVTLSYHRRRRAERP
ncbi:hypothetical protein [Streptomyces sp. NPDC057682]|uniref:hypothetical protein n=1 Tax=Streptomyces sp. NPDC057682 TaxID=3346210 RepID=UPI003692D80C